jgi:tRNA uridine 5-carboxymethylaminomethyl modification enzyme
MKVPSPRVVIIGYGHAGCEAALAAARLGCDVTIVTMPGAAPAHMPCNCSVGGPAKGHLVREIDALGGQMALAVDATHTHIRRVGTGKGHAIQTLRAQVDKGLYEQTMGAWLQQDQRISVILDEAVAIVVESGSVTAVRTIGGRCIPCRAVVVTTGTYLKGLMHCGEQQTPGGCFAGSRSERLSGCLQALRLRLGRFKTGTTPRVHRQSIRWSQMTELPSERTEPFSYLNDSLRPLRPPLPCWQTRTTEETRELIVANLHRSALYGGRIKGVGPRYCPSIEDKFVRFPSKDTHPVFLELEGWDTDSVYLQGMSTSLPADVQAAMIRTLPGLDQAEMIRPGYAVEYDMVMPDQLAPDLQCRSVAGLFLAGQINGTSGYEEAAAQGLIAGINAAHCVLGRASLQLDRGVSYIGVLIDDLITKGVEDPYRMLTSRAECRLSLRHDNADLRLTPLAVAIGLASSERRQRWEARKKDIEKERARLAGIVLHPRDNPFLKRTGAGPVAEPISLLDLLRRPEVTYAWIATHYPSEHEVPPSVGETVEIDAKYAGYVERQRKHVEAQHDDDQLPLPDDLDYGSVRGISREAAEKLARVKPVSVGQARRVPGVTPADVRILAVTAMRLERGAGPDATWET